MGKSATGKDTIFRELRNQKEHPMNTIVPYTTRPIRDGEQQGREYHFITDEEAAYLEQSGKVIECRAYNTVHGIWKYMTVEDESIDFSTQDYIAIGTLESFLPLRDHWGEEIVKPIYIEVEDGERLLRAIFRERTQKEPKYAEICRRFLADARDFSPENLANAGVDRSFPNRDLAECVEEVAAYILELKKDLR